MKTRIVVVVVAVLAWAIVGGVLAGPARADCVEVDFEVRYEDRPSWYPLGGPDYCVVPTPWTHMVEWWVERDFMDPPPNVPSGVWFHVWVPVP